MQKKQTREVVRPLNKVQNGPRLVYDKTKVQESEKDSFVILQDIQKKINESVSLNGRVDTLIFKVEKIEEEQGKISKTVGSIHNAIYDPDNGIFSRISSVKASQAEEKAELEKQFLELNSVVSQTEKSLVQNKTDDKEFQKKVETQQKSLENLEKWKGNIHSVGKWTIAAAAGGVMTILFKMISEYFGL
jgi:chromosome segregation ATPase